MVILLTTRLLVRPARSAGCVPQAEVLLTDNADSLGEAAAKFSPFLDFEIVPVNDIAETTRLLSEGVEFRRGV